MLTCRKPIVISTEPSFKQITVYVSADMHCGSAQFSDRKWDAFEKIIDTPDSFVIFAGDQMEMATRQSKSDSYTQRLRPHEQKQWWTNRLRPISHKVICIIDGNHEYNRVGKEVDSFPLYDIALALGIEDRYRSESAFVDIGVGKCRPSDPRQYRYVGYVVHKAQNLVNFSTADGIEGIDFFVSGHTHKPQDKPLGKLVYDGKNKSVSERSVENIVCGHFLDYGGYAARAGYRPTSQKNYKLILDGTKKGIQTIGFYL